MSARDFDQQTSLIALQPLSEAFKVMEISGKPKGYLRHKGSGEEEGRVKLVF